MSGTVTERRTSLISSCAGFEVVVLMNAKITVFQNVIRCSLLEIYRYTECGGGRAFRKVDIVLKNFSLPTLHY